MRFLHLELKMIKNVLLCLALFCSLGTSANPKDSCEWLFIYWAPYDNNLSGHSDTIIAQLSAASQYTNIRVVLQVDTDDSLGMYRYSISPNGVHIDTIPSEKSTSEEQLASYLDWTQEHFSFKRSAVFFLDHGGGLDEVGQDLHPDSTFLTTKTIRRCLKRFNRKNKRLIDLLYLQVCSKSSIEPLYEFHDISKFSLASQKLLGAPNYYYEALFNYVHRHPELMGNHLGRIIASRDREDMFESLTCIDNSKFGKVKADFRRLATELNKRGEVTFSRAPMHFDYGNDRYWDLIDFLDCLDLKNQSEINSRDTLKTSINELIESKFVHQNRPDNFSGISIAALSKDRVRSYWHMQFYKDFRMDRFPLD